MLWNIVSPNIAVSNVQQILQSQWSGQYVTSTTDLNLTVINDVDSKKKRIGRTLDDSEYIISELTNINMQ